MKRLQTVLSLNLRRGTKAGDTGMARVVQAIKNVGNLSAQMRESTQATGEGFKHLQKQVTALSRSAQVLGDSGGGGQAGDGGRAFPMCVDCLLIVYQCLVHTRRINSSVPP